MTEFLAIIGGVTLVMLVSYGLMSLVADLSDEEDD